MKFQDTTEMTDAQYQEYLDKLNRRIVFWSFIEATHPALLIAIILLIAVVVNCYGH